MREPNNLNTDGLERAVSALLQPHLDRALEEAGWSCNASRHVTRDEIRDLLRGTVATTLGAAVTIIVPEAVKCANSEFTETNRQMLAKTLEAARLRVDGIIKSLEKSMEPPVTHGISLWLGWGSGAMCSLAVCAAFYGLWWAALPGAVLGSIALVVAVACQ